MCDTRDSKLTFMGILNMTPDSFSDGGTFFDLGKAKERIGVMIEEGADIIDIGAESTRPGAKPVSVEEQILRLEPLLKIFKKEFKCQLSIDTTSSVVADMALGYGADMINDVSAGEDDNDMFSVVSKHQASLVLMHKRGSSARMQDNPVYVDVVQEVVDYLTQQREKALTSGIKEVIVDPGIGFGKTIEHNLLLIQQLKRFITIGSPVLIGTSRKSFLSEITGDSVDDRLEGTIASNILAYLNGATYFRVHDVKSVKKAILVAESIIKGVT